MSTKDSLYNTVTAETAASLEAICGRDADIYNDPRKLAKFSRDAVGEDRYAHPPEVVVMPSTTEAVAAVLRLANAERIPVTPRAAGSGLSGGAVPVHGGIVLAVERMNRILDIDTRNLMAVVEPGVITNHLDAALKDHGLFFAGYDPVQLMIGSEGTLGIFTEIFIRLLPRPTHRIATLALFERVDDAVALVARVMAAAQIDVMRRIKQALDPKRILNPGKIVTP